MSEFLLVVDGIMADGSDVALFVSEDTYKGAMFGCIFAEPVHGYVWCDRHGWVRSDEAFVCGDCVQESIEKAFLEAIEADFERVCAIEERAWLEAERAAEWCVQRFASQYGNDWLDEGDRGEMAYRRINRTDPNYKPVYSREQAARQDVFDMAKGKMPRAFR